MTPKKGKPPELSEGSRGLDSPTDVVAQGSTKLCSAETDLGEDALAGQQLGAEADHKAQHGETAIPGLSEVHKAKAGVVRHGSDFKTPPR